MSEKTHDPTEGRIEQARKRGQVPVSRDFARVVVCWPLAELCFGLERLGRDAIAQLFELALRWHTMSFDAALAQMVHGSLALFAVFAGLCAVVVTVMAIAGFWGQFGVLIAPESLTPSPDKLNPIAALQNMFSAKKLQEIGLSLVKLVILGVLAFTTVRDELPDIVSLAGGEPRHVYDAALSLLKGLFRLCMGTMLVLAVIDLAIQRMAHIKSLRMSLDEIIREYKENEGDPMLKGERKAQARELANSAPKKKKTEGAAAVVVNPTHFAIALAYDPETTPVPLVCAKGVDETAQDMIAHAQALGIPVIRHVWLARTLYATAKEDEVVPRPTFEATALVIAVAQALRERGETHAVLDESALPPGALVAEADPATP
jgi:type III secretion protein U